MRKHIMSEFPTGEEAQIETTADVGDSAKKKKRKASKEEALFFVLSEIFDWGDCIVAALITVVVIMTFLARTTKVEGSSMLPTLLNKDLLIISRSLYTINRNDIIVLQAQNLRKEDDGELGKPIVKRVIGVAGDVISLDAVEGVVYLNGEPLEKKEINGIYYEDGHAINALTRNKMDMDGDVTVPDGQVFVMGDNRNNSLDSRSNSVGTVDTRYIIGKVILRVKPFDKFGEVE